MTYLDVSFLHLNNLLVLFTEQLGAGFMSRRDTTFVKEWVDNWVSDNVHPTTYDDGSEAREHVAQCLAHAEAEGISQKRIEKSVGDLVDYISAFIESFMNQQVARAARED